MTGSKRTGGESSFQKDKSKEALPAPQKKTKNRLDRGMRRDPTPPPPNPHGMDEDIARWILEYLLRQPSISNQVIDSLLSTLPISNANLRLKKTLLFRQIESEYSHRSPSENILDVLEHIEELDHQDGKEVTCSESMKAAYCAVAVDCTVKFLEDDGDNNGGPYFEKVQSIWRERIAGLAISENGLVSEELLGWKDRVEAAMWDSDVRFTIFRRNTRYEAVKAVRLYVKEAWRDLGPTFLEVAAEMMRKMELDEQELCGRGPSPSLVVEEVGSVINTCRELVVYDHLAVIETVEGGVVEAESGGAGHGGESSMMRKPAGGDKVETLKKGTPHRLKHVAAHGRRTGGVGTGSSKGANIVDTIVDTSGVQDHTHFNQYRYRPNPDVNKVHETLRSSSAKLSQVVYDPLPEAMFIAETACSNREAQKVDINAAIQNKKGSTSAAAVEGIEERAVQNDPHVDDALEDSHRIYDSAETGGEDGDRTSQNHGTQNTQRKRSLMERNSTAHVSEWDDSIDESASGLSMMPSSNTRDMSLTKKNGVVRISRRRQKKRWTADEEAALRTGVEKFGVGNWKLIHTAYNSRFQDRTDGDLKDKWRNLMKSSG